MLTHVVNKCQNDLNDHTYIVPKTYKRIWSKAYKELIIILNIRFHIISFLAKFCWIQLFLSRMILPVPFLAVFQVKFQQKYKGNSQYILKCIALFIKMLERLLKSIILCIETLRLYFDYNIGSFIDKKKKQFTYF